MTTWANCWNGVNHPATAPTAEDDAVLLRGYQRHRRRDVLPSAGRDPIFQSPPPQFQPPGGWDELADIQATCTSTWGSI